MILLGVAAGREALAYRFVSMGDSRGCHLDSLINETVLAQVNQRVSALNPAAEFAVFLGDMSYRGNIPSGGTDHYTYAAWLAFMRSGLPVMPLFLAIGNHELYDEAAGESGLSCTCQQAYQNFVTQNISSTFMPGIANLTGYENLAYSFTADGGKSLFVVLDGFFVNTCPSVPYHGSGSLDSTQLTYLNTILSTSTAKTKFVFVHNPAFEPTSQNYNTCVAGSMCQFWQIVNDNNVTAVFNGHNHIYSRVLVDASFNSDNPDYNFSRAIPQVIDGTCGAPIANYTPNCDPSDEPSTVYAPPSWNVKTLYNYSVVDVDNSGPTGKITMKSYCGDLAGNWSLCDTYSNMPTVPAISDLLLLE